MNSQDQTVVDVDAKGTVFGANVEAPAFSTGGKPGVTVSGANCVITEITNGLITGATCSQPPDSPPPAVPAGDAAVPQTTW